MASLFGNDFVVIEALTAAYPNACMIQNSLGQLPIHLLLSSKQSDDVMEQCLNHFLTLYPKSSQVRDHRKRLPAYYASIHSNVNTFDRILRAFPDTVNELDSALL